MRALLDCRACHRPIDRSVVEFFVHTDGHTFGPIGPVCVMCALYAIDHRNGALTTRQTLPHGEQIEHYYPDPWAI